MVLMPGLHKHNNVSKGMFRETERKKTVITYFEISTIPDMG